MVTVRTHPIALLYGVGAVGLFCFMAALRKWGVAPPVSHTWDAIIFFIAEAGLIFAGFFGAGHLVLRHFGISSRSAYVATGSAATIATFCIFLEAGAFDRMLQEGTAIFTFCVPAVVGAIVGFTYHVRAGYAADGDDPELLRRALASPHSGGGGGSLSGDGSHVDIGSAEYFSGPLQVRTSIGTMLMAAFGGIFIYQAGGLALSLAGMIMHATSRTPAALLTDAVQASGMSAFMFLGYSVLLVLPFAAMMHLCHHALRAMDKTSPLAYGVAGLIAPIAVGMLTLFSGMVLGFFVALPCAIAMVLYRNMAGLEPKPVKENIEVRDRRNLVGADHARRRYGRVVVRK